MLGSRVSRRRDSFRFRAGTAAVATWTALFLPACARKAPGPEECHELARAWVFRERATRIPRFGGLVLEPGEDAILERTTQCLTTPYDRELVECIGAGGSPRACFAAFQNRHSDKASQTSQTGSPEAPPL